MTTESIASYWGLAESSYGFFSNNGNWHSRVYGFLRVLCDKQVHPDFRSSEKWILCAYSSEEATDPVLVIPGCKITSILIGRGLPAKVNAFDVTVDVAGMAVAKC